jgi:hypothetical protein
MIVEALIGGVTVCFVSSLQFARWVIARESASATPRHAKGTRKAIEAAIEQWHNKAQTEDVKRRLVDLENQLFELGEED